MANAGVLAASAKVQESLARKSWGTGKQQTLDIGNGPETPKLARFEFHEATVFCLTAV